MNYRNINRRSAATRRLAAVGIVLALGATACATESKGEGVNAGAAGTETVEPAADAPTQASAAEDDTPASGAVAAAEQVVEEQTSRPETIGVSEPVPNQIPESLDVFYLTLDTAEAPIFEGLAKDAAEALGWNLTGVNGGLTPESMQSAMQRVVREQPDIAIVVAYTREFIEDQIQQATENGTEIIFASATSDAGDGVVASIEGVPFHAGLGEVIANYVVADSGGDATTVVFDPFDVPIISDGSVQGFLETYEERCPDCAVDVVEVSAADIGQGLPTEVVAYLRQNPDTEYIMLGWGGMTIGVPGALADAGIDPESVKIVTSNPSAEMRVQLAEGSSFLDAVVDPDPRQMVYLTMDVAARVASDSPLEPALEGGVSTYLLTRENIDEWPGSPEEDLPIIPDWHEQFTALWNAN